MAGDLSPESEEFIRRLTESIEDIAKQNAGSNNDVFKNVETLKDQFLKGLSTENQKYAKALIESSKELKEGIKNTVSSLARGGGSFSSVTTAADTAASGLKALGTGLLFLPGHFKALGFAVAGLGIAIQKITPIAGAVLDVFESMYSEYEKLSKLGIVTTFTDFQDAIRSTGMNIADAGMVLGKFSNQLAGIGGSAIEGRKQFMQLAEKTYETNQIMQRLGFSSAEYSSSQIDYLEREARAGRLRNLTQTQLIISSQEYILEIEKLSKLTGQSREAIQEERKARLNSIRFRAVLEQSANRQNIEAFLDQIRGTGPGGQTLQNKFMELMASGVPIGEMRNLVLLFNQAGVDLLGVLNRVKTGQMSASEATQLLANSIPTLGQNVNGLAGVVGGGIPMFEDLASVMDLQKLAGQDRVKLEQNVNDQIKRALTDEDKANTGLASTRRNLYNAQRNIQLAATSLTSVARAADALTGVLNTMTSKIRDFAGPEKRSYEADEKLKQAVKSGTMTPEEANRRFELDQRNRPLGATSSAMDGGPGVAKPGGTTLNELQNQGIRISGSNAHKDGEPVSPKLIELAKRIQSEIPEFKHVTGLNDPHTRKNASGPHFSGRAMDFTLNKDKVSIPEGQEIVRKIMSMGYGASALDEYNFKSSGWTAPHFHVQIPEFKDGGVINGPTLGLLGEAGPEVVMPLKPENVPPEFMTSDKLSELSSKMDTLISVMQRQTNVMGNVFDRLA